MPFKRSHAAPWFGTRCALGNNGHNNGKTQVQEQRELPGVCLYPRRVLSLNLDPYRCLVVRVGECPVGQGEP